MIGVSIALLGWTILLMGVQGGFVGAFLRRMRTFRREDPADQLLPRAGVVLAVRGADPFLSNLLEALFLQDYPDFEVYIVLDDEEDATRTAIESAAADVGATNVTIDSLREPAETCTLKCSAMRQAVTNLQPRCEVIAFIDGDVVPHRLWLRDLVCPLRDPAVGASTGNRWYMPRQANWGSLVRYFWNAGAVVQMWLNGMTWGGSMALRVDVIRRIDLLSAWSRALSVDCTVCREVRRHGYRVRFVPGVIAVNTESIPLSRFLVWVRRQLVAARTPPRNWAVVLLHGALLTSAPLAALGLAIAGVATGRPQVGLISGTALVVFSLVNLAMAIALECSMRRIVRRNGQPQSWLSPSVLLKLPAAMLLTVAAYPFELARASFCRRISWRGVEYEVTGLNRVRMLEYRPFRTVEKPGSSTSLV